METLKPVKSREFDPIDPSVYIESGGARRSFFRTMVDKLLPGYFDKAEARRLRVATHFMRCPLCDSLSVIEADECGTCSWRGAFDHDPASIESRFAQLIQGCPSLSRDYPRAPSSGMSFRVRFRHFLRTMIGRRVDYSV